MSKEEINGFLVDTFNQHSLEEGAAQGTCPLCSSDRQPKNVKAKCASYDWERGLGTCHNCDTSFQLHTYQRKGASEKIYVYTLLIRKLSNGLNHEVYPLRLYETYGSVRVLSGCLRQVSPKILSYLITIWVIS